MRHIIEFDTQDELLDSPECQRILVTDVPVTIQKTLNGTYIARQINTVLPLSAHDVHKIEMLFDSHGLQIININPRSFLLFLKEQVSRDELPYINEPVIVVFFSSVGALYGARMNVRQPSEGMWVLSTFLGKNRQDATCLCVDPNEFDWEELSTRLDGLIPSNYPKLVIGTSTLVLNLENDAQQIMRLSKKYPQATHIVGGIGAEALDLLPNSDGSFGISSSLHVDAVVPGISVLEINALVDQLSHHPELNTKSQAAQIIDNTSRLYTPDNWDQIQDAVNQSRSLAMQRFIPTTREKTWLFFDTPYVQETPVDSVEETTASVLTNNECNQRCWFCSTPKDRRFSTVADAFAYITTSITNQDNIAFNNNDLDVNPQETIELCTLLSADPRMARLKKHGKISVTVHRSNLIQALKDANFVRVAIGVESFDDKHRGNLKGPNFNNGGEIRKTLQMLIDLDIIPEINLILFHPEETFESLRKTTTEALDWIEKGAITNIVFSVSAIANSYAVKKTLAIIKNNAEKLHMSPDDILTELKRRFKLAPIDVGDGKQIMFPATWKAHDQNVEEMRNRIHVRRITLFDQLDAPSKHIAGKNYVPVISYISLVLIAQELGIVGYQSDNECMEKVQTYVKSFKEKTYIGI